MCLFLTRYFDEKLKNKASFEGKPSKRVLNRYAS